MNSPLQPSDTQMPVSSYPHVFPRRHGAVPVDLTSATPRDVSAAQCSRSPGDDEQATCGCCASAAGACPPFVFELPRVLPKVMRERGDLTGRQT